MDYDAVPDELAAGRHLLFHRGARRINCSIPAIDEFPAGFFTKEQREHGAILIHVIVAIYILVVLGIIAHEYFVPAIEKCVSFCNIESDVTGASIMAVAGSAPQLATSIIGFFVAKSEIGVGSVVGASFFNVFFIAGFCAFFTKETAIKLAWWPLMRDGFFYALAAGLVSFLTLDKKIHAYDAAIMVATYGLYVLVLCFNSRLEHVLTRAILCIRLGFARCACKQCRVTNLRLSCRNCRDDPELSESIVLGERSAAARKNAMPTSKEDGYRSFDGTPNMNGSSSPHDDAKLMVEETSNGIDQKNLPIEEEYRSVLHIPKSNWKKVVWVIFLPALLLVYLSMPDAKRPDAYRYTFVVTILLSVVLIGASSYVLVWMLAIIGSTIGIPDAIMGVTFLAAGASIPDIFNAIIVTRHGYGDMAISNCFGSNIFDILVSLGLPWLLAFTVATEPLDIYEDVSTISIALLASAFIVLICLYMNKFMLNRWIGGFFMIAYCCFVIFTIIFDSSTLLPTCESKL